MTLLDPLSGFAMVSAVLDLHYGGDIDDLTNSLSDSSIKYCHMREGDVDSNYLNWRVTVSRSR
jgi:hypothetical protein